MSLRRAKDATWAANLRINSHFDVCFCLYDYRVACKVILAKDSTLYSAFLAGSCNTCKLFRFYFGV